VTVASEACENRADVIVTVPSKKSIDLIIDGITACDSVVW